jgi:hypothetical protein
MVICYRLRRCAAFALAALLLAVASCTSSPGTDRMPTRRPLTPSSDVSTGSAQPTTAASCPVTTPVAVPRRYPWRAGLFGWGSSHGNGRLWVGGLGADGVIAVDRGSDLVDRRGGVSWKLGWWRGVAGELNISGRRLDGAGRLGADAGTVAEYGPRGFVASGVRFSDEGCWEVTGRVDGTVLTFVARVTIRS